MADTTKVRTTFNPGVVLEVGDAELLDLKRQRLLHSHEALDKRFDDYFPASVLKSPNPWKGGEVTEVAPGQITATQPTTEDQKG